MMYRGLVASGGILALFGGFLVFIDFFVPLGVSIVGLPISLVGAVMLVLGFFRKEPLAIEPEQGKKFCWYCMKQIPKDATECAYCSLPQHDAID
jgi:hypothetical protein